MNETKNVSKMKDGYYSLLWNCQAYFHHQVWAVVCICLNP